MGLNFGSHKSLSNWLDSGLRAPHSPNREREWGVLTPTPRVILSQ